MATMSLLSTISVIPQHVKFMMRNNNVGMMVKFSGRKNSMNMVAPLYVSCINNTEVRNNETPSGEMEEKLQPKEKSYSDGLGIVQFLSGKVFLVTGATGFLAKVLVEKILRMVPDVDKIYILIKAKDKDVAMKRLKNEIIASELFNDIRKDYGISYEAIMLSKLVPVAGDVCESGLGMDMDLANCIANEVNYIISSAANTKFDERYDIALDMNTLGPCRLLSFAKRCKKLFLFMHVSTAYVNGLREGIIAEKKFQIGESIASEKASTDSPMRSVPRLDVTAEIKMAMNVRDASPNKIVAQKMKQLGFDRSRIHGWQDVYVFTKAMGEMMIESQSNKIPIVIIRPSIVESSYKEPVPGWIQGNRMMDPIILSYGKGQISGFPADPEGIIDVVPVDMVANAMLAAMVKHGKVKNQGPGIYHICSSVANPMSYRLIFKYLYEYFRSHSQLNSTKNLIEIEKMIFFASKNDYYSHLEAKAARSSTGTQQGMLFSKILQKYKLLADIYEPYTFYRGRFDNTNMQLLLEEMSEEERRNFGFDVKSIDWKDYICNIHIPGLMRYMKSEKKNT